MENKVYIITGSRHHEDELYVFSKLDRNCRDATLIVQGGCRGADWLANKWSALEGIHCATIHALWNNYGRMAGPKRNVNMVKHFPKATLIAFPLKDSVGTHNCIEFARNMGLEVKVFEKDV